MRIPKKIPNPENIKDNLEEAIYFVESKLGFKKLGINLTNIEKVELRKITELTTMQYINDKTKFPNKKGNKISPSYEAGLIFMNRNYGFGVRSIIDNNKFMSHKRKYEKLLGYDPFPEFFAKLQEEMHLP
jgi:hypothetical protein